MQTAKETIKSLSSVECTRKDILDTLYWVKIDHNMAVNINNCEHTPENMAKVKFFEELEIEIKELLTRKDK